MLSFIHENYCTILLCVTIPLLFCYWLFEVHYFLRFILCAFIARFVKRRVDILNATTYAGICLTTDVDTLLFHMNNTRYLREVDFARADFYVRTRLWQVIKQKKGSVAQVCTNIRYRRFIRPFSLYTIQTRIVCWDKTSIFMEHKFVTKNEQFINAIVMSRQQLINCDGEEIMDELVAMIPNHGSVIRPCLPIEFARWVESNKLSSARLRNNVSNDADFDV